MHTRQSFFQKTRHTGKGSCGAAPDRDGVDAPVHLLEDFARGGFIVIVSVGGIVELCGQKCARIGSLKIFGALDSALHALGLRSSRDLGAEGAHDDYFFLRKFFGHKEPDLIAAIYADQSEANAGISGGSFNDGASRLEFSISFGAGDYA